MKVRAGREALDLTGAVRGFPVHVELSVAIGREHHPLAIRCPDGEIVTPGLERQTGRRLACQVIDQHVGIVGLSEFPNDS